MSKKVFLKHQVNWNTVCGAIREMPFCNIWRFDNSVEVLNEVCGVQLEFVIASAH